MRIFLTNLGKYNEGEWVDLPVSHEEYEEYFITDYECDLYEVGEYENLG